MEVLTRAVFNAARDGDASAMALLETAAEVGTKAAEKILLQLTRENMAATGEKEFNVAFPRVAEANPELHRAYLNANGTKNW